MKIKNIDKWIGRHLGDIPDHMKKEIINFHADVGVNSDRVMVIMDWVKMNLENFVERWNTMKQYHNSELEYLVLRYGYSEGTTKYRELNKKKTRKFPNKKDAWKNNGLSDEEISAKISELQKKRSMKSPAKLFPSSVLFWAQKGYTEDEAIRMVSITQTRDLNFFEKKYGAEVGAEIHQNKIEKWLKTLKSRNDYEFICWSKGLGLQQYIHRYGEIEGKEKYQQYRKQRCGWGKPSKESKIKLEIIKEWCDTNGYEYMWGFDDKIELHVTDSNGYMYWYDFCIPNLMVIVEYNGETYHPNPKYMDTDKWVKWKHPFENITADEKYQYDMMKNKLAKEHGYYIWTIWSSDEENVSMSLLEQLDHLKNTIGEKND